MNHAAPSVSLAFLTCLLRTIGGDVNVTCVYMSSCILPVRFQVGENELIHWLEDSQENALVHSYYNKKEQLQYQNKRFEGRTSMFKNQIPEGNASLLLEKVGVLDRGRYKCYISTVTRTEEFFVNLEVNAPVSRIDIQQIGNTITCRSNGIYPEPKLTWTTSPPSLQSLNVSTSTERTDQQLYNIRSSLTLSESVPEQAYSCSVSTPNNKRRATLKNPTHLNSSVPETTLHCSSLEPLTGLLWTFNGNQTILRQTGVQVDVSQQWRQHVKRTSPSSTLILHDLSSGQNGMYTCESSNAEETHVTSTFLRVAEEKSKAQETTYWWVVGLVVAVLVLALVGMLAYLKLRGNRKNQSKTKNRKTSGNTELQMEENMPGVSQRLLAGQQGKTTATTTTTTTAPTNTTTTTTTSHMANEG
ncbi:uncharacterized protein ACBR49_016355 isoform 2-T2 [Aulostomus maculatus]